MLKGSFYGVKLLLAAGSNMSALNSSGKTRADLLTLFGLTLQALWIVLGVGQFDPPCYFQSLIAKYNIL